jgi:hypothetical protein
MLKCPLEYAFDEMFPDFGPERKCPLDFILEKMSLVANCNDKLEE